MKQIIVTKYGDPNVLKVEDVNVPDPKENEIRIRVYYAGVNFAEIMA